MIWLKIRLKLIIFWMSSTAVSASRSPSMPESAKNVTHYSVKIASTNTGHKNAQGVNYLMIASQ